MQLGICLLQKLFSKVLVSYFSIKISCTLGSIVCPDNSIVCKLAAERLFLCLSFIPTGFIPKKEKKDMFV